MRVTCAWCLVAFKGSPTYSVFSLFTSTQPNNSAPQHEPFLLVVWTTRVTTPRYTLGYTLLIFLTLLCWSSWVQFFFHIYLTWFQFNKLQQQLFNHIQRPSQAVQKCTLITRELRRLSLPVPFLFRLYMMSCFFFSTPFFHVSSYLLPSTSFLPSISDTHFRLLADCSVCLYRL